MRFFALALVALALSAGFARADTLSATETFTAAAGQTRYSLTRSPVLGYTVAVRIDDMVMAPGLDFTVDEAGGVVVFKAQPPSSHTIVVDYRYESASVKVRPAALMTPVSASMLGLGGDVSFRLPGAQSAGSQSKDMCVGVDAAWRPSKGLSFLSSADVNAALDPASCGHACELSETLKYAEAYRDHDFTLQTKYSGTSRHPETLASLMSLSLRPTRGICFSTSYKRDDNILDPSLGSDVSTIAAKIAPAGPLSVEASTTTTTTGTASTYQDTVSATLVPDAKTKMSAGVTETTQPTSIARVDSLAVSTQPVSVLSVSGDVRLHETTLAAPSSDLTTVGTQAGLAVCGPLKLTGSYCEYPDDSGAPKALFRRGLGLQTHLGILDLSTDYAVDTPAMDSTETPDAQFGITGHLKLASSTSISGKYIDKTFFGLSDRVRTYTLALNHTVAGLVDLSISGTVNVQGQDTSTSNTDASTAATIGVKF